MPDKAVVKSEEIPKFRSWVSVCVLKETVRPLRMDIVGGMSVLSVLCFASQDRLCQVTPANYLPRSMHVPP